MTTTSTLYVGIDISLDTNQVCVMNFDQHKFFNRSFENSSTGSDALIHDLSSIMNSHDFSHIIITMEATSVYFFHIANKLSNAEELKLFTTQVFCLNAKIAANYKKSFLGMPKNDPLDAYSLCDFARVGRTKSLHEWRGANLVALQRLTRYRYHLASELTREKNYVLNNIFLKFSQLRKKQGKNDDTNPFSDLFGATASSILTDFATLDEIVDMPMDELVEYLDTKGKHRFTDPHEVAVLLKKCANGSYRLDRMAYDAINIAIASSLRMIKTFQREIKDIDQQISDFVKGLHSNDLTILTSIPGIGPVFAAGIIAEIGSIECFSNQNKLAKFIGLTWNEHSSGSFVSEDNELFRTGNSYLRYYITEAANKFKNHDSYYHEFYTRKYNEAKTHKHKRALVLTSRKFVKLIYAMLHRQQLYSETGEVLLITE
jgi:transposase